MNILVCTASRHGSTREIGDAIARTLREEGHTVRQVDVEHPEEIGQFDTAIIGSAIYMGKWLPEAREFVERNHDALVVGPLWLFSSGPIGPSESLINVKQIEESMGLAGARSHAVFGGRLDRSNLGPGERFIARVVRTPEGDFRNWDAIQAWAHSIAAHLSHAPVAV
jgi:menaquinone-dependent protoporphyrinogen oxidase